MPEKYLFVDFDDTLSDPFQFNVQYVREIGALLAPKYGGDAGAWAKAAIEMLETLEADYVSRFLHNPLAGYCAWLDAMRVKSAELLFHGMGLPTPENARELAIETQFHALVRCDAAFPGATEALRTLAGEGYRIQVASGQESAYLIAASRGAGLERYTESKFGPDLIDCAKEGPEYYARIFAKVGVRPEEALIVDDHPEPIRWALQSGAQVIQAQLSTERYFETVPGVAAILTNLADLPALVNQHHPKNP